MCHCFVASNQASIVMCSVVVGSDDDMWDNVVVLVGDAYLKANDFINKLRDRKP